MSTASILHADLDAFYASVEQRDHPWLRGRPVIVGSGVVLAASYEAKAFGVRTAMSGAQAHRLCPHAAVVPPRMSAYAEASRAVFAVFADTTPLVEPLSIDEAFLDVGGLLRTAGTPVAIATGLRRAVLERVGLVITVGVARTKFLAKVASGVAKPDGLLCVPPDAEREFLHPLPVERLWGVGRVTATRLRERGIRTVSDVAGIEERSLVAMLGSASGRHLHALAHNRDPRPVQIGRRRRSVGAQRALGRRRPPAAELDVTLVELIDRVTRRLRTGERLCRTVTLRLRFDDYARVARSHSPPCPTAQTATILAAARVLLHTAQPVIRERGLTLVGVALSNLDDAGAVQLELPFASRPGGVRAGSLADGSDGGLRGADHSLHGGLDGTLDGIRDRFGPAAVTRAVLLGRHPGLTVPLLPE